MNKNSSPAGWVVQVTIPAPPDPKSETRWKMPPGMGAPSFQYYNVAIAADSKAVEATRTHLAKASATVWELQAVRQLSSTELATLKIQSGDIAPA